MSYFVGFTPNAECSPDIINACLYAQETDAEVTRIRTGSNHGNDSTNEVNENMGKGLFQVVKDHNNPAVKRMVAESKSILLSETAGRRCAKPIKARESKTFW